MKKILKMLAVPAFLLAFAGCSQDVLEDINFNKNNPADVSGKLLLTDAIASSAFTMTSSDLAFYASIYIEHNAGIWGQMNAAEIRGNEPTDATTYNNQWGAGYTNLLNLKTIIEKTSVGGSEDGNYHLLGMAQILTAYNWAILTDGFGDIPFTEALQPGVIFQPKLDKQELIYQEIFKLLDEGIANLKKTTTYASPGVQDLLYGGSSDKWQKFAQGLKARYTTRLSLKNAQWDKVIEFANASFATKAEEAAFKYNGSTSISPWFKFYTDRNYLGASASLNKKLTDANDPRKDIFWKPNPKATTVAFVPAGSTLTNQSLYGVSALSTDKAPTFMLSYHELEFLKAEAYVRTNNVVSAWPSLEKAVKAAFTKVNLHDTIARNYLRDQVKPRFDVSVSNALKEVMFQKYIAFFEEEALEAYNDIRRLKAAGENLITLEHPESNKFPWRFTYGADDVTTNLNVLDAYGDGSYVYTEKIWWAGGTK